jgi:UDP-N-acetylglucosamine transferase subunit ALG13
VDSATRLDGPSQTGRLAQRLPNVRLMAQSPGWGDPRWDTVPSVLDAFESRPRQEPRSAGGTSTSRVVLSLGTELWPFPRAVEGVLRAVPDAAVTWQTGATEVVHEGTLLQQWLPAEELHDAFAGADAVITHAGVGSVLACLRRGKVPVVLPRSARRGEHIDDHQHQFARLLAERGLAVCVDPDELTEHHLERAAGLVVRQVTTPDGSDPLAHPLDRADDPGR